MRAGGALKFGFNKGINQFTKRIHHETTRSPSGDSWSRGRCRKYLGWMDIKKDLDLSKIEDVVKFFQRLLNERANSETPKVRPKQVALYDSFFY